MESALGKIISLDGRTATVEVATAIACQRCAAGKGCGAGLLQSKDDKARIKLQVPADFPVGVGENVELNIAAMHLLRAALLAYGLPLLTMLACLSFFAAFGGEASDAAGVILAVSGLALGVVAGRILLRRDAVCAQFVPTLRQPGHTAGD